MVKKEEEFVKGYEEYFKEGSESEGNCVIIAGRPMEVYTHVILLKFGKYDQVILKVADKYVERALLLLQIFGRIGITPTPKYTRKNGSIFFIKEDEDISSKDGNSKFFKSINKIVISKIPDLYLFTDTN